MNFGPATADPSTPTLQSETRRILNDESTAANQQWSTADIKNCLNIEYDALRAEIGTMNQGWTLKSTTINTVADTRDHALPSDFVGAELVMIELDGKDISSDSTADPKRLEVTTVDVGEQMYEAGDLTETRFWYIWEDSGSEKLAVVAPPGTGGTNSLLVWYRSDSTYLSSDGDAPLLPTPFHIVLPYGAAMQLLLARGMDTSQVAQMYNFYKQRMLQVIAKTARNLEGQMSAAGLNVKKARFRFGKAQRP